MGERNLARRRARAAVGLAALLMATGTLPAEGEAGSRAAALIDRIDSAATPEAERTAALRELRLLTSGEPQDPETREALFFLARYLQYRQGPDDPDTRQVMSLATTQYPDDARTDELLQVLAPAQHRAGDYTGAHVSFRLLLGTALEDAAPQLLAQAAVNAAAVDDHAAAFRWVQSIDLDALRPEQQLRVLLARVESCHGVGRDDLAVEAAAEVERRSAERLHVEADALLAAAGASEGTGDLDRAISRYETYVNVHRDAVPRPVALLALARLYVRTEAPVRAERVLRRLIDEHAESTQAAEARVQLVELAVEDASPRYLPRYIAAAREERDGTGAQRICDHVLERYIAAGHPAEAIAALALLARDRDAGDSLAPLAARTTIRRGLEAVLELLISRDDMLGVAATAAEARSLDIPIPAGQLDAVRRARRALGLETRIRSLVGLALEDARPGIDSGDWARVAALIEDALLLEPAPHPEVLVEATLVLGEALWRTGRSADALTRIDHALATAGELPAERSRALQVLRGDIRFAAGEREQACGDYRAAAGIFATPWVDGQLERCAGPQAGVDSERS